MFCLGGLEELGLVPVFSRTNLGPKKARKDFFCILPNSLVWFFAGLQKALYTKSPFPLAEGLLANRDTPQLEDQARNFMRSA